MEVAVSVPEVLKVFPLRIMTKGRFSITGQEIYFREQGEAAASSTVKEMEEGEIDPESPIFTTVVSSSACPIVLEGHSCSEGLNVDRTHLIPPQPAGLQSFNRQRQASSVAREPSTSSLQRNHTHFIRFSNCAPKSLSEPQQTAVSKSSGAQASSAQRNHLHSSRNVQHGVPINPPETQPSALLKSNGVQSSSPQSQPSFSLKPNGAQSSSLQRSNGHLPPSLPHGASTSPPKTQPSTFLECNGAHSSPPQGNHHHFSLSLPHGVPDTPLETQPSVFMKSNGARSSSLQRNHWHLFPYPLHAAPGTPETQLSIPQESCGAQSASPQRTGSPPKTQPTIILETNGTQCSVHAATCAAKTRADEKVYVTCSNGKKRPRSSAIRDYPEGCGSYQAFVERSNPGKVFLTEKVAKTSLFSGPSLVSRDEQGRVKLKLVGGKRKVGDTYGCPKHSYSRLENQTAPHKSLNTSVPPWKRQIEQNSWSPKLEDHIPLSKRQIAQDSLPLKVKNQIPSDYSHRTVSKKFRKVLPLSRVVSCDVESMPPPLEEIPCRIDWYLDDEISRHSNSPNAVGRVETHPRLRLSKSLKKGKLFPSLLSALPHDTDCYASSRFQVKKTLQEFDCVRRSLAVEKERNCRPDLAAARILKNKGRWQNCREEKIVGHVPGVEVGDQFSFRIEMLIIGLHRQVQGGIDYIAASVRPKGPLATSIVASGGYEDDNDHGATFIYTGQGGNNYKTDRRQGKDQILQRGNLALSNSFKERTPVRVIRGSLDDKFYTYDGLYDVIDCWFQIGVAGFGVYQYKLSRRPGQPELVSSIIRFMGSVKKKGLARPHVLLGDLSRGKERLPVSVVNEVDEESPPELFIYIPKMKYSSWYHPEVLRGCDCVGGCVDASKCLCAAKNGGDFPYNELGQIVTCNKTVFECGKSCACPSSCYNRVSQKGLKHQLEVFKTRKRGWGVRSLEPIRPGDFICEYAGELLSDADAERRTVCDEYLFDIGHRTNSWMDVSDLMDISNKEKAIVPVVEDEGYTIDARLFGSVARFINHSCSPNLYAQNVVYDSDDLRFPHVMLFAMENIPPMRELAYDYNYTIGHVRDANGEVKSKACYCGAGDCRGRLY